MTVLQQNFRGAHSTLMRGGGLKNKQTISPAVSKQITEDNVAVQHRKPPNSFKPMMGESKSGGRQFSNSNNPLIVYDSKPLAQVLEQISFKRKPKSKTGMGVKLVV